LNKLADSKLKETNSFKLEPKDYITLSKFEVLPELTPQDSLKVIKAIFSKAKKADKIAISDGMVVYSIVEQKLLDNNSSDSSTLDKEIVNIKNSELSGNLLKELSKKYSTVSYVKDFQWVIQF